MQILLQGAVWSSVGSRDEKTCKTRSSSQADVDELNRRGHEAIEAANAGRDAVRRGRRTQKTRRDDLRVSDMVRHLEDEDNVEMELHTFESSRSDIDRAREDTPGTDVSAVVVADDIGTWNLLSSFKERLRLER